MHINPMKDLGKSLNNPRNAKELAEQAGINQPIKLVDLYQHDPAQVVATKKLDKYMGLKYGDTLTGVVGQDYSTLGIVETLDVTMGKMLSTGLVKPKSAGILKGGQKIWVSSEMDLPETDITGDGDKVKPFITNIFDNTGKGANFTFLSVIRIWCENTLRLALRERDKLAQSIRIAHKGKDPLDRVKIDAEVFQESADTYFHWTKQAQTLARLSYSRDEAADFLEELFPTTETQKKRGYNPKHDAVRRLAKSGQGQARQIASGTWWGLVNGVTEYVDHYISYRASEGTKNAQGVGDSKWNLSKKNNRFESVLFGAQSKLKAKALDLALVASSV